MPSPATPAPPAPPTPTGSGPGRRRPRGPGLAALVLAVLFALLLALVVASWAPLLSFDRTVADTLHERAVREPGVVHANRILTDWIWDPWTMRALTAAAVGVLLWRGRRFTAVWLALTVALGTLVQQAVKYAVGRERPSWPDPVDSAHYSAFPSGHAMTATVVCGVFLWLLRRAGARGALWWAALGTAVVSVVGVGWTRLYLGVHWFSDILGAWLLGACWAALAIALFPRARRAAGTRLSDGD
jgi:membrane-associated phospholipid phosphatase